MSNVTANDEPYTDKGTGAYADTLQTEHGGTDEEPTNALNGPSGPEVFEWGDDHAAVDNVTGPGVETRYEWPATAENTTATTPAEAPAPKKATRSRRSTKK